MRKISILALTIFAIGGAYALTAWLFPENDTRFPRVPTALWTIGWAISDILGVADLANYLRDGWDGTVENSEKLGWITADNYLKHNTCTNPGDVWIWVWTDGTPLCGPVGSLYATEIWTLNGVAGTVTITKHDGSSNPGVNWDTLYYWDTLSTASASSGSITFSDASIVRLGPLTSVELSTGENPDGQTVAEIILADGSLWSRVISTDGINIWWGGYIAWVRGTSLSVVKSGPNYTFSVVDSTTTDTSAVELKYGTTTKANLARGSTVTVPADTNTAVTPTTPGKNTLLATDWIGTNTVLDMEYMLDLKEENTLSPTLQTKLDNEFDVTVPSLEDTSMCSAIEGTTANCGTDDDLDKIPEGFNSPDNSVGVDAEAINDARKQLKALNILCRRKYNGVFWPTIGKCVKNNPNWNIIFAADFTNEFFSDPNQFVPMPIASTKIKEFWEGISPTALKWRTMSIAPIMEYLTWNVVPDDGNLWRIDWDFGPWKQLTIQWKNYIERDIATLIEQIAKKSQWDTSYYMDSLSFKNLLNSWIKAKFETVLIENTWNKWNELSGWDNYRYSAIYLRKPSLYTPWSAIKTGQFLGYPITELNLLNKRKLELTISDDNLVELWNVLVTFDDTVWVSKNIKKVNTTICPSLYKYWWDQDWNVNNNDCVERFGNTIIINIPANPKYLIIGNNESLNKPINITLESLKIY